VSEGPGLFITLEGGEGAGKSTAARHLAALFEAEGFEVVATREPGGTPGAENIRKLLLATDVPLTPLAQTMLHFAARADHVEQKIIPALARGAVVICDRFYDSTTAYQAFGQGVDAGIITTLIGLVGLIPDITFILEASESVANSRRTARGGGIDRYEVMGADMMARIAAGFRAIAAAEPLRCAVIDADQPIDFVVQEMRRNIRERTGR
jgi:dTMP kinase